LRYSFSIVFMLLALRVVAQQPPADSLQSNKFLPTGIRVGVDAVSVLWTKYGNTFSGYEFSGDVDFYRYYLTVETGKGERNFTTDAEVYSNSGTYWRVGVDVNFLKKDPDKNMFFFGARYGWGRYSENLSVAVDDPVWGTGTNTYHIAATQSTWGELTTGLRVKMWKFFWMGYTARLKFALNTNTPEGFVSPDVPGYGRTDKGSAWGFNYQLLFRIPVRKSPHQSIKKD
jgi:hypothetical protein